MPTTRASRQDTQFLVVDDHPIVRQGLIHLIQEQPGYIVIGEAAGAAEVLEKLRNSKPDMVITDLSLKDISGIELIKQIRAIDSNIKILVSSMHDESLYAERVLRAGAQGYLNKEESGTQLLVAIRRVLGGKVYLSDQMTDRMLYRVSSSNEEAPRAAVESLSDRELEVFELIGDGFTTREIASRLYLSIKTIETYREHIKTKLNVDSSSELVRHAVRWRMEQESPQYKADPKAPVS